jgi:two-component system alkaline phosphatase synthesis response regulator PhoP
VLNLYFIQKMKEKDIKILLVDDEPDIIEIVRFNLKQVGYQIFTASDGLEALKVAEKELPHLIILDVMMSNLDGIETCERLRQDSRFNDTIIMFLTARGEDYSYVAAFEVGADDYVTKPIKPKVLVSKVKGLLRRFMEGFSTEIELKFNDLTIDKEKHKVVLKKQEFFLPRKEFKLLCLLASKPGKVFKRENIMEKVWGNEVVVGDRTIDVHIRKLREKLGDHFFKTIKGVGYKFIEPEN